MTIRVAPAEAPNDPNRYLAQVLPFSTGARSSLRPAFTPAELCPDARETITRDTCPTSVEFRTDPLPLAGARQREPLALSCECHARSR